MAGNLADFRHNVTTLESDISGGVQGRGTMRRRASAAFNRFAGLRRVAPAGVCAVMSLMLAHCSSSRYDSEYGVSASPRVIDPGEPVPKGGGTYRVGSPYVVAGRTYVPRFDPHYRAVGLASWYGEDFYGRYTANGEVFDMNSISAANPVMPLPSYARVTNLNNGRSLIVRVNDRGPYAHDRVIDLSMRAAILLGIYRPGTAPVRVEYVGPAPLAGSDDRVLAATLRDDRPAPLPSSVRLAGPIFPPAPPPPSPGEQLASASRRYVPADPPAAREIAGRPSMSYANPSDMDGTAQVLNGRGLY
jgi:rare lipoprotein A